VTLRTVNTRPDISYLQNRLDFDSVLESLGIKIAFHLGNQIMCHCPNPQNHENGDANPSFGLSTEEMVFNCFVCGGGTLLDLVKREANLATDDEAVLWLQQHSTMQPSSSDALKQQLMSKMYKAEAEATMPEYPAESLFKYRAIHPYIYERGITKDVAVKMQVGFDEIHCGIMIPHVWRGKLVGWQLRHLVHEGDKYYCDICLAVDGKVPKYKSTKGLPVSRTLYNYDNVVADGYDAVIIVESPMSALYLMSNGYPNVVATFGSYNSEQLGVATVFPTIYLWPDNDPAGEKNVKAAIDTLRYMVDLRVVPVVNKPKGDAADVSPDNIKEHISRAFTPALLPLFNKSLVTLDDLSAHTNR
jgi:DNA primase